MGRASKCARDDGCPFSPGRAGETAPARSPVTFQVGIESNETSSYSGLVLYFLTPNSADGGKTPEERGIYSLEIDSPVPVTKRFQDAEYSVGVRSEVSPMGTTFFAESIGFLSAGDYVVKLVKPRGGKRLDAEREVLSQITVHVQNRSQAIWFPFWDARSGISGAESGMNPDKSHYAIVPIENAKGGAAIPGTPRPQSYVALPSSDTSLPHLINTSLGRHEAEVSIAMSDSTLVVKFKPKMEGFFPQDNFLTQWWVNEKQVNLDPTLLLPEQARALAASIPIVDKVNLLNLDALVWFTNEVHFDLGFKPDRLEVKKGDKVSVQLLYCPWGYQMTGTMQMPGFGSFNSQSNLPPAGFSEASNRIDFVYSGDPLHPQQ